MSPNLSLDHNVSMDAVPLLAALGFDVITANDVGLAAAKDDEHLPFAAQQRRVLITYNVKDFRLLHDAWRRWSLTWQVRHPHSGILILPQPHFGLWIAWQRSCTHSFRPILRWRTSSTTIAQLQGWFVAHY